MAAFLSGGCSFLQIADTVEAVLDRMTLSRSNRCRRCWPPTPAPAELARAALEVAA